MKERAPIQIQGMFLSRQSWILPMPFLALAQKQADIKTSCAEQEPVSCGIFTSARDEHYVLKRQIQLVWIILIMSVLHSGISSRTQAMFFFSKSLYVEKQTLMMNLYLTAEDLDWPDVWKSRVFYHILSYSIIIKHKASMGAFRKTDIWDA